MNTWVAVNVCSTVTFCHWARILDKYERGNYINGLIFLM